MELFNTILLSAILAESTYLVGQTARKSLTKKDQKIILIDTSVLMDGRIVVIANAGFLSGKISIPRSVVGELQYLADNSDSEKRSRARHGLDIISELQAMSNVDIQILQDSNQAEEGVDNRLLNLAKKYNGTICTIDYNLNKVAKVEGIEVLNVNDLAMGLRMSYLPGEKMSLELTGKGQDSHQAVGHLVDGTMVVVEKANNFIGKTVEIEFIRSLQTAAGKMMFAKLVDNRPQPNSFNKNQPKVNKKPIQKKFSNQKPKGNFNNKRYNNNNNKPQNNEQNLIDLVNKQN